MQQEAETSRLLEVRGEASQFMGREITDAEWNEAYPQAERKLAYIIGREGDANGARRQPWYLGKLVEEAVAANAMTNYCLLMNAIRAEEKAASEESGQSTTTPVYQGKTHKVNPERRNTHENPYPTA